MTAVTGFLRVMVKTAKKATTRPGPEDDASPSEVSAGEKVMPPPPRPAAGIPIVFGLMRASNSARNLVRKPSIGQAAASPSAQMVLPPMPLAMLARSSTSPASPSPRASRLQTRDSQPEPSRHGVHWPQDSWA